MPRRYNIYDSVYQLGGLIEWLIDFHNAIDDDPYHPGGSIGRKKRIRNGFYFRLITGGNLQDYVEHVDVMELCITYDHPGRTKTEQQKL